MNENNSYGYIYSVSDGRYGHIYLEVCDLFEYSRMRLKFTSQCGTGYSDGSPNFYAVSWGIENTHAPFMTLIELELATKYMRNLNKKLAQFDNELGYTSDFTESLHRLIRASGTNDLYISDLIGSARDRKDCAKYKVKLDGKFIVSSLKGLEQDVLAKHSKACA